MVVNSPSKRSSLGRTRSPANANRPPKSANVAPFQKGSLAPKARPSLQTVGNITYARPRTFPANFNVPPKVRQAAFLARRLGRLHPAIRVIDTIATVYQLGQVHVPGAEAQYSGFTRVGKCATQVGTRIVGKLSRDDFDSPFATYADGCLGGQGASGDEPEVGSPLEPWVNTIVYGRVYPAFTFYRHTVTEAWVRPDPPAGEDGIVWQPARPPYWLTSAANLPNYRRTPRPRYEPVPEPLGAPVPSMRPEPGITMEADVNGQLSLSLGSASGRPPPGTEEIKARINAVALAAIRGAMAVSDGLDFLEILAVNSGLKKHGKGYPPQAVLYDLFVNGAIFDLDVPNFVLDLVLNEIEDKIIGKVAGGAARQRLESSPIARIGI